jgi:CBS domain-containing protein
MQVNAVMTRDVDLVGPNMRLKDAAIRMRDDNCGALPVGENDRLIGMVTDRNIAVRGVAEGKPASAKVRDVMSEKVFYCFDDNDVAEAARLMSEHQVPPPARAQPRQAHGRHRRPSRPHAHRRRCRDPGRARHLQGHGRPAPLAADRAGEPARCRV